MATLRNSPAAPSLYGLVAGGILAVVVVMALVTWFSPPSHVRPADAAAVLGLISAAAIGIERVLEGFWTLIDLGGASTFGPFKVLSQQIDAVVNQLTTQLTPQLAAMAAEADRLKAADATVAKQMDEAKADIATLAQRIAAIRAQNLGGEGAQQILTVASEGIDTLQKNNPALSRAAGFASDVVDAFAASIATFQDNPGRRLISLFLGVLLGLGVAGLLDLDVVQATLQTSLKVWIFPQVGIALTGVAMGLGSNPTHELIKVLQTIKQTNKSQMS